MYVCMYVCMYASFIPISPSLDKNTIPIPHPLIVVYPGVLKVVVEEEEEEEEEERLVILLHAG